MITERMIIKKEESPSPGSYVLPDSTMKNSLGASALRSNQQRFVPEKPDLGPGPGMAVSSLH